jgi:hypothetical protein
MSNDIVKRKDLYKPVSLAAMRLEAAELIDPETVQEMEASWELDGDAFIDNNDPGHYLARKLVSLDSELNPSGMEFTFDDRMYFSHPLDTQRMKYPNDVVSPSPPATPPSIPGGPGTTASAGQTAPSESYAFSQEVNLLTVSISDDSVKRAELQLANLGYPSGGLAMFKSDKGNKSLSDAEAMKMLENFHSNPAV